MADSSKPEIFCKKFLSVSPRRGESFGEQLEECLKSLEEKAKASGLDLSRVLMQTIFVRAQDHEAYHSKKALGTSLLSKWYIPGIPATSFVAQHPGDGKQVSLEAVLLSHPKGGNIHRKSIDGIRYTTLEFPQFKEVYAAGLANFPDQLDPNRQCGEAFESMKRVLKSEGLDLSHIVRQWNYIENFLDTDSTGEGARQIYQIFNDCRAAYYSEADFPKGYPASTGIGMFAGGVVLECIALKSGRDIHVAPLSNPLQRDAHAYTQEVLEGDSKSGLDEKAPPLFERAKILTQGSSGFVFVSGTAAVRGQNTIPEDDIQSQTAATLKNIDTLISAENLLSMGLDVGSNSPRLSQLRAYVKREKDLPLVKTICREHYGNIPSQYVISEICRDALLVEIEGTACVSIHGIRYREGG